MQHGGMNSLDSMASHRAWTERRSVADASPHALIKWHKRPVMDLSNCPVLPALPVLPVLPVLLFCPSCP